LSELLDKVAGKPLQVEVSAVRVLFELLGFLLETAISFRLHQNRFHLGLLFSTGWLRRLPVLTGLWGSVYNGARFEIIIQEKDHAAQG
jgi:hypothetical protein